MIWKVITWYEDRSIASFISSDSNHIQYVLKWIGQLNIQDLREHAGDACLCLTCKIMKETSTKKNKKDKKG